VSRNTQKKFVSVAGLTLLVSVAIFVVVSACSSQSAKAKPNYVFKDAPKAGVLAKIGNEEISEEMLIGAEKLTYLDIKKKEYEFRLEQLNKLLEDRLLGAEAKKANMNKDEYIDKKVIGAPIKVTDADFKTFIKQRSIPESQINPALKDRITGYMQQLKRQEKVQEYVAKLTKNTPVEVYFKKPKGVDIEVGNAPTFGNDKAAVTIVEFSDFQCPYCSRGADVVNQIKSKYGNKVRIAFRSFPLPMHKEARPASEAALCANEQGTAKFWKFHDLAFKNQSKLDNESLMKYAKDVGADVNKFKECFEGKKYAKAVQDDMDYGEKIGVKSTPTFFVNGQLISGALPLEAFSEIIDAELAEAK